MRTIIALIFSLVLVDNCFSQNDSTLNNLVLPPGYKTSEFAAMPVFKKTGKGARSLILIPGLGLDKSIFDDFVNANKSKYKMYVVTIPGFGNTQSPPLPKVGTSYGEQTWSNSVLQGLKKLIDKERLNKPIIVGHFTLGTQIALRMAIDYPDNVGGVIVLGGPARMIVIQNGNVNAYPLKSMIYYTDNISAPKFYKTVKKDYWDQNNYMRELYSLQGSVGDELWKQVAAVPVQVMIHYLLEFHASDITLETSKIKCPVLVIRPGFKTEWLSDSQNGSLNYIKPQFVDSWEGVKKNNPLVQIQDISTSATCLWKDQPAETYKQIDQFVSRITGG